MDSWKRRLLLHRIAGGDTYAQAARAIGVSRVTLWRWIRTDPELAADVAQARQEGADERTYPCYALG